MFNDYEYPGWAALIGLKVVAYRGVKQRQSNHSRKKETKFSYVLFDDGKTYLELDAQDYYTYHDCNTSARTISVVRCARMWKAMFDTTDGYYAEPDALELT